MSRTWCSVLPGAIRLAVQITANAKKTQVTGVLDDAIKLRLQAQPVDGKANEALVTFIAKALGVQRGAVTITHGQTNKKKLIEVVSATLTPEEVERKLVLP